MPPNVCRIRQAASYIRRFQTTLLLQQEIEAASYSGAGKSTLLRLINLLERPDSGKVNVCGQELTALDAAALRQARQNIGMVFQQFNLLSNRTVADNVAFPLEIAGWSSEKIKERVKECLEIVGLTERADHYPAQLSGGQKQRVGIARALAPKPQVILADEPSVDRKSVM